MNRLLSLYPGDAAAALTITAFVQVAAIVALAWLLAQTLGRRNPAALYGAWLCALVCIPVGTLAVGAFSYSGVTLIALPVLNSEAEVAAAPDDASGPIGASDSADRSGFNASVAGGMASWFSSVGRRLRDIFTAADIYRASFVVLAAIWVGGVTVLLLRLAWGFRLLGRLCRELRPADLRRVGDLPERVRRTLGMQEFPRLMVSPQVSSPISLGLWRPTIVMPQELLDSLDVRQLHDVLVHECAHFLKRDHAMGLLERAVQIVFWVHPAVYVLSRELARAREELCDNYVLCGGNVPDYARTLLLISQRAGRTGPRYSSAIGFLQGPRPLEVRVRSLLDRRRKLVTRMNRVAFALLAMVFVVTAAAIAGTRLVPAARREAAMPVRTEAAPAESLFASDRETPVEVAAARLQTAAGPGEAASLERPLTVQAVAQPIFPTDLAAVNSPRPRQAAPVVEEGMTEIKAPNHPQPRDEALPATLARATLTAKEIKRSVARTPAVAARAPRLASALPTITVRDMAAELQPSLHVEPESGVYWITLRLGSEAGPRMLVEPGEVKKLLYEESLSSQVAMELTVEEEPGLSEAARVSYRLAVRVDPQTTVYWEAQAATVRMRQWNVMTPALAAAPVAVEEGLPAPAAVPGEVSIARLEEARRLLVAALRLLGSE